MSPFNTIKLFAKCFVLSLPLWGNSTAQVSGIYFVVDDEGEIIYVGKSVNLAKRIRIQQRNYPKERFLWKKKESPYYDLLSEESFWISVLRPKYNRTINCGLNYER